MIVPTIDSKWSALIDTVTLPPGARTGLECRPIVKFDEIDWIWRGDRPHT